MDNEKTKLGILRNVKIEKMWGKKDIYVDLDKINLFIGKNGTGKTTLIKIIEAVACHDINTLININFKKCELYFDNGYKLVFKKILKSSEEEFDRKQYNIPFNFYIENEGKKIYTEENDVENYFIYKRDRNGLRFAFRNPVRLNNILDKIVKLSWIPLERSEFSYEERDRINENLINRKLEILSQNIQKYKSEVDIKEKDILNEFRNKIFELMLYDNEIDSNKILKPKNNKWIDQLKKAFRELGLSSEVIENKIESHVNIIENEFEKNKDEEIYIPVYPLFNRSQKIIKYSQEAEKKRKKIRKDLEQYIEKINYFINKEIDGFNNIDYLKKESIFRFQDLSSGEKQILILLSEALLQRNERVLFIADEPELSLHISWQREIVGALTDINTNAQIIFATHSPEVVSKFTDYIIDMEDILK